MGLDNRLESLKIDLIELQKILRKNTFEQHSRINPFSEDLFDWKERGDFWCGEKRNVTIYNSTILIGDVEIGNDTWIGPYCSLDGGGGLKIGRNCSISVGCQILTHDTINWALSGGKSKYEYSPVKIGNCCFIGTHVVITKGVSIGDHCLVAAGAVVTKDFPSYSIIGGVPAKKIGNVKIDNHKVSLEYLKDRNDV